MQQLDEKGGSSFFLGAAPETLQKIKERAAKDFPNVKIHTYSPPYKAVFTREESKQMWEAVNAVQPDALFVGMTAPKQEKWVYEYKEQLNSNIICSIGAVFDFYAGTVKRPSQFWIKLGLEWLPRFVKEPRRLAERNLVSTPKFVWEVLRERMKND
jgi:N-acetylglucosaminyldiphosphoundecaprenol N-acetyl-beta-D-mannosaminyltransferase